MKHRAESNSHHYLCTMCVGGQVEPERADLLKDQNKPLTCKPCGNKLAILQAAKYTVAIPYNKGAYQFIYDPADMVITNPKRTI